MKIEKVQLTIPIVEDKRDDFLYEAKRNGTTMTKLVNDFIDDYLNECEQMDYVKRMRRSKIDRTEHLSSIEVPSIKPNPQTVVAQSVSEDVDEFEGIPNVSGWVV